MTDIKTNPVPGAQVTLSVAAAQEKLNQALDTIANIIAGLPFMLSTQSAMQRLSETRYWTSHALSDKARIDEQEAQKRKESERKEAANSVREKVDINAS